MGSGYQDIDLIVRYKKAGNRQVSAKYTKSLAESHDVVGYPLPNSSDQREDRNHSKTVNCYNPERLTWGKMNEHNYTVMSRRTQLGEYIRNHRKTARPGWPYQIAEIGRAHV